MFSRGLIRPLRKWWWLVIGAPLIAALATYLYARQQPPTYQARTTIMVGRAISDPNPTSNEFFLGQQLAGAYADIALREPVREAAKEALGMTFLPEYEARPIPNSQFFEILVVDSDQERVQVVANELAKQLLRQSPTSQLHSDPNRQQFVIDQLDYLEVKIDETQDEIVATQIELGDLTSARQIQEAQDTLAALQGKLTTLQASYAALLSSTVGDATNTLAILEQASSAKVIGPSLEILVVISAALGLGAAVGGVYLIEYFDNTLYTPEDIEKSLHLPVIGYIPEVKGVKADKRNPDSFKAMLESSPGAAEAFRFLRTNLQFAWYEKPPKSILVTSFQQDVGKAMVSARLAASLAAGGKQVILIDADFRRPSLHRIMGTRSELGLSDILEENLSPESVAKPVEDTHLKLIANEFRVAAPLERLGSIKFHRVMAKISKDIDFVVFNSPPLLVAESLVMASRLDGVLIVMQPGKTSASMVKTIMDQLARAKVNIWGVVLNRIPRGQGIFFDNPYFHSKAGFKGDKVLDQKGVSAEEGEKEADSASVEPFKRDLPSKTKRK